MHGNLATRLEDTVINHLLPETKLPAVAQSKRCRSKSCVTRSSARLPVQRQICRGASLPCSTTKGTDRGSLRHDRNVRFITGIEGDYDAGLVPFEDAAEAMRRNSITGLIYTSPSHTNDAPRWRILCPTSCDLPPADRKKLVARVNGALSGALGNESFTLSQSY